MRDVFGGGLAYGGEGAGPVKGFCWTFGYFDCGGVLFLS